MTVPYTGEYMTMLTDRRDQVSYESFLLGHCMYMRLHPSRYVGKYAYSNTGRPHLTNCWYAYVFVRERLVAEREGAARAWETSLRNEQRAAQQALSDAGARARETDTREAALRDEEQVSRGR